METHTMYRVINHLDAPKRMLALTMDEFSVVVLGLMLFVASNHKWLVGFVVLMLLNALKYLKQGRGPRFLLVLAYWSLPSVMTRWFLTKLPASYCRVWKT